MKKILVTGGAGFIGSHTVVELVLNGYEPIIVDNFSNSEESVIKNLEELCGKSLKVYKNDCTSQSEIDAIFEENEISGVIHFAAFKAVAESIQHALKYHKNNVNSMNVILESMKKYDVPHLVFSSSCTVYGDTDHSPVTEDSEKNPPTSPYGATKVYCEKAISDVHAEKDSILNAIMLRYFNPIGAHPSGKIGELPLGSPNNLVPYITQTAAGIREQLTIFGNDYDTIDGTCIRDYIHVVDVAKAHVLALKHIIENSHSLTAMNLGLGKGYSVLEVVKSFEEVNNIKVNYAFGTRREGDIPEVFSDASLAKKILNWEPKFSLNEALQHAWEWEKSVRLKNN